MKVRIYAELPERLAQHFLQTLRDFDGTNPGCHFEVLVVSDMDDRDVARVLDAIDPPFRFRHKMTKQ